MVNSKQLARGRTVPAGSWSGLVGGTVGGALRLGIGLRTEKVEDGAPIYSVQARRSQAITTIHEGTAKVSVCVYTPRTSNRMSTS